MGYKQRIDFNDSRIYWNHGSELSHGIFRVEAILRLIDKHNCIEDTYALSTGVLAGNMYAQTRLVKCPSYYFQIAASNTNHVIFRTDTKKTSEIKRFLSFRNDVFDSKGRNNLFKSLNVDLKSEDTVAVKREYKYIKQRYLEFSKFTSKVRIPLRNSRTLEIELPIKHINIFDKVEKFQVETGPVLFVNPEWLLKQDTDVVDALIPAFVHFNQYSKAEFSIDFPYGVRYSSSRREMSIKEIDCDINIYSNP